MIKKFHSLDFDSFSEWFFKKYPEQKDNCIPYHVGSGPIQPVNGRTFDFSDEGKKAAVMRVYNQTDLVNLVAWLPAKPSEWFLFNDDPCSLGYDVLQRALTFSRTVTVYGTPMDWILGGGKGCCPLNVFAMEEYRDLREINCDEKTAAKLRGWFARMPRIVVKT